MSKDKRSFAKQQHYIPQFVLKNFQNEDNNILLADAKRFPMKAIKSSFNKVMREKDFYEIKDDNGNYILRNYIEDIYSRIEGDIKPSYQEFIDLSKYDDFQDKFVELIRKERWPEIESNLLLYLIITLIRSKKVKKLVYENSNLKGREKYIMYLLFTTSQAQTIKYAKRMYKDQELENILHFIKSCTEQPLKSLFERIMSKYQIRVHRALGNKKFFLSDNPVIVQKFEGEDYHLPISPEVCIGLVPIKFKGDKVLIDNHVYNISDENVDRINEQSILNTDRMIIINSEDDLEFISNVIDEVNNKLV